MADPSDVLDDEGLWLESSLLRDVNLLAQAEALCASGRVLTSDDERYPARWRQFPFAPPALWVLGDIPAGTPSTIVGRRDLCRAGRQFARQAAVAVADARGVIVSGGAIGADREAAAGAAAWSRSEGADVPLIEVVPMGLSRWDRPVRGALLSAAAPEEGFSTALAMERNALLYAMSERSLVVGARLREGGAWAGASEALRRRSSTVCVWADGSPGAAALEALGAQALGDASAFTEVPLVGPLSLFPVA